MSKLDDYARIVELKKQFFATCTYRSGPFTLIPSNKGKIILSMGPNKDITDISPKELEQFRDLINCFLKEVVGNE